LIDLCLLIVIAAIWNTHSRAGLVSFLIAALFFIGLKLLLIKGRKFNLKTVSLLLLFGISFLIVIADDVTAIINSLGQNSEDSIEYVGEAAKGRVLANKQIIDHYSQYWLTGVGPGAYEVFFVNHRSVEQVAFFDHAHNDYFEFLIEYGIFSLVLFALLSIIVYRMVQNSFPSKSYLTKLLGFAAISAIIYMLTHGTMDFNARIPANVVTLIVVISLVYARFLMKKAN
jgi:O-antigen ligase